MENHFVSWIVTDDGIISEITESCYIPKNQLLSLDPDSNKTYEWLLHIPEKTWLKREDVLALNEAFRYAAKRFSFELDEDIYKATLVLQKSILDNKKSVWS